MNYCYKKNWDRNMTEQGRKIKVQTRSCKSTPPPKEPTNLKTCYDLYYDFFTDDERQEFFAVATRYTQMCDQQRLIWPKLKYRRTYVRAAFFCAHNRPYNSDVNIEQLAHHLELSRTSTYKRIEIWRQAGLMTVANLGCASKPTTVYGTREGFRRIILYTNWLQKNFKCQPVSNKPDRLVN